MTFFGFYGKLKKYSAQKEGFPLTIQEILEYPVLGTTISKLLTTILLLLVCVVVVRVLTRLLGKLLEKSKIEATLRGFLGSAIRILLWFLVILILADHLGIPISSLLAILSIAGLAASLAMQNTLSNIAGGILILLSHPFRVGDFIECSGVSGKVKRISLVYTQLNTLDNRLISIPNSEVSATKVENFTAEPLRRVDLLITASYDAPADTVKTALTEAARAVPGVLPEPETFAGVNDYQDSAIQYVLRTWCRNEDYWTVRFALTEEVRRQFDAFGVEMTYPHMNVHIVADRQD